MTGPHRIPMTARRAKIAASLAQLGLTTLEATPDWEVREFFHAIPGFHFNDARAAVRALQGLRDTLDAAQKAARS